MNMEKRAGWGANDQREKRVIGRGRSRRLTRERERVVTPGFAGRPLCCWSIFGRAIAAAPSDWTIFCARTRLARAVLSEGKKP